MSPRKPSSGSRPVNGHWVTYKGHHLFFPGPAKDADPVAAAKARAADLLAHARALKAARPATTRRAVDNRDGVKPGLVKLTGRQNDGPSMRANDRSWLSSAFYDNYARVSNFLTTPKKTPASRAYHYIAKPLATGFIDGAGELYGVVRHPITTAQGTAKGLYIVLTDPGAVGEAVYMKYEEFQNLSSDERMAVVAHLGGKAAFELVSGEAMLKAKEFAKLKYLAKAKEAAAKASTVVPNRRLFGGGARTPGNRIPLDGIPVTKQPTPNTCVPASLDMLLEEIAPGRAATSIKNLRLAPKGMASADMLGFIDDNLSAVGMKIVRGDLPQALKSGQPFIAVVDEGHAVVVQGTREVNGVRQVVVRDPLRGAYMEPIADFDARLVRDSEVLAHPTIRGKR